MIFLKKILKHIKKVIHRKKQCCLSKHMPPPLPPVVPRVVYFKVFKVFKVFIYLKNIITNALEQFTNTYIFQVLKDKNNLQ